MSGSRVPRVVVGREIVPTLPLNPTEGFVLSRIDGVLSEEDIGPATGLSDAVVLPAIAKLRTLNVIRFDGEPDPSEGALRKVADDAASRMRPQIKVGNAPEEVDLDESHRARIVDVYSRLSIVTHYELLGVDPGADKKEIKKAYFELASIFHPDRFFRKKLGTYKEKMESIFGKMTEAHDVLTSKQRADYDARIGEKAFSAKPPPARTAPVPAKSPSEIQMHAVRPEDAVTRVPQPSPTRTEPAQSKRTNSGFAAPTPATSAATQVPSTTKQPATRQSVTMSATAADKREAFARRILGGRPSVPPGGMSAPNASNESPKSDPLRNRYDAMKTQADRLRARQYAQTAEDAFKRGDLSVARRDATAAKALAPEDPLVKAIVEKVGVR